MLSVIVPAHNEEGWIGPCLEGICAATAGLEAETIVVNDGSTDRTAAIAAEHGARVLEVDLHHISAARNAGARQARGEVFIFVDADTLVTSPAVQSAMEVIQSGATGGGFIPEFEGRLPLWFRLLYPAMAFGMRYLHRQTGGACLFCTRAAFEKTGGFSEAHFAAEEVLWIAALKRHGRFIVPRPKVITSGRNLRVHSARTIVRILARVAFRGPDAFRTREGLDLWYQPDRKKQRNPPG